MLRLFVFTLLLITCCNCLLPAPVSFHTSWLNFRSKYPKFYKKIACDNNLLSLECPPGSQLYIVNANYGRYSSDICPSAQPNLNTKICWSLPNTTSIASDLCSGRDNCQIQNFSKTFGPRCPNTYKYVQVSYICKQYTRACEGDNLKIVCPPGKVINVYGGNFGRTLPGSIVCPSNTTSTTNTNCTSGNAVGIAQFWCNGKNLCTIPATNEVFGDSCPKTWKYLEVKYLCE